MPLILLRILIVLYAFCSFLEGKTFDCFPFLHEFELLKMRIYELDDQVDYFVLVESIETQRGDLKPLYFEENKHLFEPYLHKIIHVAIRDRHPEQKGWDREHFQRNCILKGLKGKCKPTDVIIISDVDEIPKRKMVAHAKRMLKNGATAVRFQQKMFYYKINLQNLDGKTHGGIDWIGSVATTYETLKKFKQPQYFRKKRETIDWPLLRNSGWHFSSMGTNEMIRLKLFSVIEGADIGPSDSELASIFQQMKVVAIDDSFPQYVRDNYDTLKEKGFILDPY